MSYGHCIVLPNQNRDTVQIISVQEKATLKEYKAWELHDTTRFQMGTMGLHVQQHYWPCYDASNVHDMRSQLCTQLKLKSTELLIRASLLKKHAWTYLLCHLSFNWILQFKNKFVWVNTVIQEQSSMHNSNGILNENSCSSGLSTCSTWTEYSKTQAYST